MVSKAREPQISAGMVAPVGRGKCPGFRDRRSRSYSRRPGARRPPGSTAARARHQRPGCAKERRVHPRPASAGDRRRPWESVNKRSNAGSSSSTSLRLRSTTDVDSRCGLRAGSGRWHRPPGRRCDAAARRGSRSTRRRHRAAVGSRASARRACRGRAGRPARRVPVRAWLRRRRAPRALEGVPGCGLVGAADERRRAIGPGPPLVRRPIGAPPSGPRWHRRARRRPGGGCHALLGLRRVEAARLRRLRWRRMRRSQYWRRPGWHRRGGVGFGQRFDRVEDFVAAATANPALGDLQLVLDDAEHGPASGATGGQRHACDMMRTQARAERQAAPRCAVIRIQPSSRSLTSRSQPGCIGRCQFVGLAFQDAGQHEAAARCHVAAQQRRQQLERRGQDVGQHQRVAFRAPDRAGRRRSVDAIGLGVGACRFDRGLSMSTASTCPAPYSAAPMARMPEPHP